MVRLGAWSCCCLQLAAALQALVLHIRQQLLLVCAWHLVPPLCGVVLSRCCHTAVIGVLQSEGWCMSVVTRLGCQQMALQCRTESTTVLTMQPSACIGCGKCALNGPPAVKPCSQSRIALCFRRLAVSWCGRWANTLYGPSFFGIEVN